MTDVLTAAITGHRQINGVFYDPTNPSSDWTWCEQRVDDLLHRAVAKDPAFIGISGMALGADTLYALRMDILGIPFIAAVPFEGQCGWTIRPDGEYHKTHGKAWPFRSRDRYYRLLDAAMKTVYVCPPPFAGWKMQKRNEWMVDKSTYMFAIWTGIDKGGTWNCIHYARRMGKRIYVINPITRVCGWQ